MKDKSLKILLRIIAVCLTLQTINQIDLFPAAYAQNGVQMIAICDDRGGRCAGLSEHVFGNQLRVDIDD